MKHAFRLSPILCLLATLLWLAPLAAQQNTDEENGFPVGVPAAPPVEIPEDLLAEIRQRNVLQVGIATYTPWAMYDNEETLMGFEVDVAEKLAGDMGVEIEFHLDGWADLLPDLLHGDFDVIIAGMSITPQRALLVNFTRPYAFNETTLLANQEKAGDFATVADFNKPAVVIGVWAGSVGVELAGEHFPEAEVRSFETDTGMFEAVREGSVHAVVASSPRPQFETLQYPEAVFMPLEEPLMVFGAGMAVRKGDADFLRFLDSWIQYHSLSRWLSERRDYWFGSLDWAEQL